jgi:hypothetical protein
MALEELVFTLKGLTPLLLHNGTQLSDPLSRISKELKIFSAKKSKVDDDHRAMRDLEWIGALYTDEPIEFERTGQEIKVNGKSRLILPGDNVHRMLFDAGKHSKMGQRIKDGVLVLSDVPLEGGETVSKMFVKPDEYMFRRRVKLGAQAVMRTRCILRKWSATIPVHYQTERIDAEKLIEIMETAGRFVGLGDWRPRYGTFQVDLK